MFFRDVSEKVTTTNSTLNIENSICLKSTKDNMNDDEKNLALNEFNSNNTQSIVKEIIKQEPIEKNLYKFEYSNSQSNIIASSLTGSSGSVSGVGGGSGSIGGSTTSSSPATNSASTSPSARSSTSSTTNRKYSYQEHSQPQSAKRKTSDHHHSHHNHSHHRSNNSHSSPSSSQHQVYHQKPVYSEFVSSKCILLIYYKGDLSFVIDDHFKKSMTLNAAKSSASISPLSLSSASTSPSSKSSSKSNLHKTKASNANHWNKNSTSNGSYVNNQSTNYENWSFYNQQSQQQQQFLLQHQNQSSIPLNSNSNIISSNNFLSSNDLTSSPNGNFVNTYDSCWNRTTADVAASLYTNHAHYHYANNNGSYFNEENNLTNTSNSALVSLPLPADLNIMNNISGSSSPTSLSHTNNLKNNIHDSIRTNSASSNSNKLSPKSLINIKEETQLGLNNFENTNGSFLNAVAASINPYAFQNNQLQHDHLNSYTIPTPNSSSSPQSFSGTNLDSNLFCDYSSGSSPSSSSSNTVAKVAASLSYASAISAAAAAAVANSTNNTTPSYHRYPQYLNNQIDCRRSSNPHYSSHLASHLQYQGFDLNNVQSDAISTTSFKDSTSNSNQAYASPIWY